jgi:hypothetical protein
MGIAVWNSGRFREFSVRKDSGVEVRFGPFYSVLVRFLSDKDRGRAGRSVGGIPIPPASRNIVTMSVKPSAF